MINIPYDPILHDLSLTPREMSAAEIVEYWLGKGSSQKKKIADLRTRSQSWGGGV